MTGPGVPSRGPGQAQLRRLAVGLVTGGVFVGIGMPALLHFQRAPVVELAPGIDAALVIGPAVMIVDLILAYWFWKRADAAAALERTTDDPVERG